MKIKRERNVEMNQMNLQSQTTLQATTKVNTQKENQDRQNNSNEMEDIMLKGHPLLQIS